MQENLPENSGLLDRVRALRSSIALEVGELQDNQYSLVNRVLAERDSLEVLLQAETRQAIVSAQALERAMEQVALLENHLRQRSEESKQAWADVRASEVELTTLREAVASLQHDIIDANAWVFRLAGERRSLEQDNDRLRRNCQSGQAKVTKLTERLLGMERKLAHQDDAQRALQADLDYVRHKLQLEQAAASEAFAQALARNSELAEKEGLLRARATELALARDDYARLANDWQQFQQQHEDITAKLSSNLEAARQNLNRLEHDKVAQTRVGEVTARKLDWLVELKVAEARTPFWWRFLPGFLRRWLQFRYLARKAIFDADAYCARYPDVVAAQVDPLEHYICRGLHQERLPF